jgi:PGF-CTERM protein
VEDWSHIDSDTIKVFLNVPGDTAVSGSGYLAKMTFKVEGDEGDECVLDIDNGLLGNITAEEIVADWIDATIKIGKKEGEDEQQPPGITAWEPAEDAVSSTEGESITFEISVDQEVDISWQISGIGVQTDEGVTEAAYTNTSAVAGTWNVSAIATSTETGLSSMHTWIWSVTAESTEASEGTPTLTLAPGVTPTPTPKATSTPGQTVKATPTVKPTSTPKSKETAPTPTSKTPGFEAIFAIAAMSAIAYILVRRR